MKTGSDKDQLKIESRDRQLFSATRFCNSSKYYSVGLLGEIRLWLPGKNSDFRLTQMA